jgi:16S rRNA (uracil1498-N3)-methyltransferase
VELEPGTEVPLEGGPAHYLGRVLRANRGQTIVAFNGDGHDYVCEILSLDRRCVTLEVQSRLPATREPGTRITIVQAISRGERMEQTLQKCTELGACAFQPLVSERVEVRLSGEKLVKRLAHWQGVVVSACEQSGRAVVPSVYPPLAVEAWLEKPLPSARLLFVPGAVKRLANIELPSEMELVVGPEGGFSDPELALIRSHGAQAVSLGPRVLRTETAAPAALAVIQALRGDM